MAELSSGPTFTHYKTAEQCPDRAKHTPDPPGCLAWHEWAEKKAKTHDQFQCRTCGFWVIWKRKKSRAARESFTDLAKELPSDER